MKYLPSPVRMHTVLAHTWSGAPAVQQTGGGGIVIGMEMHLFVDEPVSAPHCLSLPAPFLMAARVCALAMKLL